MIAVPRDGLRIAGQVAFAGAAAFVLATAWPEDAPGWLVLLILVLCSPLVGDFSATMAARYVPSMDWRACFGRLVAPSRCDRCGVALSQADMLPFFSSAAVSGKCSCGSYDVPRSYSLWSAISLAAVLALSLASWATGMLEASPAVALMLLSFMPAIANDVRHGEVDPALLALGVGASFMGGAISLGWTGAIVGFACGGTLMLLAGVAAWFAVTPAEGGRRKLPLGAVDVWAAAGACSVLELAGLASFLAWCVPTSVAALLIVRLGGRGSVYGPSGGADSAAFPCLPVIVAAACLAALIPIA